MIYLNFLFDYTINAFLPIKTYFIASSLEENNFHDIIIIGLIIDLLYFHLPYNTLILIILYLIAKKLPQHKYFYPKNIFLFTIYYLFTNFAFGYTIINFFTYSYTVIVQVVFLILSKLLLNKNYQHIM